MDLLFEMSRGLSAIAFLAYGLACLFSDHMVGEFTRYGLARYRRLVGAVEVAGALGLVAGYWWTGAGIAAAAGLTLLMLAGVATRVRVRDSLVSTLPAIVLLALNAFVVVYGLQQVGEAV